jgi:NAD(P) transhydrogenase
MGRTKSKRDFDVIVIGSGPGGEGAALQAAKEGLKVAVVERNPSIGGNCTHTSTIPSKALRQFANNLCTQGVSSDEATVASHQNGDFAVQMAKTNEVIAKQVAVRSSHYSRNNIEVYHGLGHFKDEHTLVVDEKGGIKTSLTADYFVVATGSRPYHPPKIDFSHPCIYDSDTILKLRDNPRTITVLGAGVVGCEYTSIFKSLGRKVNLINSHPRLLSFLDDEISDALSYHLRDQGVLIRNNEELDRIEEVHGDLVVNLQSGKKIRTDIVLFAIGRVGNTDKLALENLKNIETNSKGNFVVNSHYQTSIAHIYAVGDLTGFPNLASAAYDQGRFAIRHLLDPKCDDSLVKDIPLGIYTSPEISCIGRTEKELTSAKVPYEIGHTVFRHLARAQIAGQDVGMLKILFHSKTLEILGVHCFGHNAAEIIHIGQAIMAQKDGGNTLRYFTNTTFNYPTMAEAYRVAALNGLNRLCL